MDARFDSSPSLMKKKSEPKPEYLKRLTRKEKGFVADLAKGKNGTQAALNNYDTDNPRVAASIASENLTKPNIVKALADAFPDELLQEKHLELLRAAHLETMTFPLGPRTNAEKQDWLDRRHEKKVKDEDDMAEADKIEDIIAESKQYEDEEVLSDEDIKQLLSEVNCTVKRIVRRYQERTVYYWAADNQARDKALDKAYKIRGSYAAEKLNIAGAHGEPLFTDEHKSKSKSAIAGYIARRNTR